METTLDKLFTVPEAARYLRISKSQLYLLVERKKIPHIRLTERRVVIRESDLKLWIEKKSVK